MPMPRDKNELGALWIKTSKNGVEYMSGTINGVAVVCFHNDRKDDDDNDEGHRQPDWRVLKSQPRSS